KSFGWADVNGGRPVETRLLIHRASGWTALPYIWDADGKDATLALGGRRVPVTIKSPDGETHSIRYAVPNKNQCKECHSLSGESGVAVTFKCNHGKTRCISQDVDNKIRRKERRSLIDVIVPIRQKVRNFILDPSESDKLGAIYFEKPAALNPVMPQWDDPE